MRHAGPLKVSAGILFVAVEEEVVNAAVEVVVMGDILLRPADGIALIDPPLHAPDRAIYLEDRPGKALAEIGRQQVEQLVDR
jgi:hypothetical protein